MLSLSTQTLWIFAGLFIFLLIASIVGQILQKLRGSTAVIVNLNARIRAWWWMCIIAVIAISIGTTGSVILFGFMSFLALRELITLSPTRGADHPALFWCFF